MVIELGHGLPFFLLDPSCILFLITLHVYHQEVRQSDSDALSLMILLW